MYPNCFDDPDNSSPNYLERQSVCIAVLHRCLNGGDPDDGHQGAKGLLPGDAHVGGDMVEQGGPDEVALPGGCGGVEWGVWVSGAVEGVGEGKKGELAGWDANVGDPMVQQDSPD